MILYKFRKTFRIKCLFSKEPVNDGNGKAWKKLAAKKNNKLMKKKKYKWHRLIGTIS
jgi:hypothetical protein